MIHSMQNRCPGISDGIDDRQLNAFRRNSDEITNLCREISNGMNHNQFNLHKTIQGIVHRKMTINSRQANLIQGISDWKKRSTLALIHVRWEKDAHQFNGFRWSKQYIYIYNMFNILSGRGR